jgi:nicotinamide riboside kinase
MIRSIAIVGPESTGKSSLTKFLAAHYNTSFVPEFSRTYLSAQNNQYQLNDLDVIAQLQKNGIDELYKKTKNLFFIDTELYVLKIWSEIKFKSCSSKIIHALAKQKIDAFLLCDIDLPWQEDPQREYPDNKDRTMLMHYYQEHIANDSKPFAIINGAGNQRNLNAIEAVEKWKSAYNF